jgi:hypothetical protein
MARCTEPTGAEDERMEGDAWSMRPSLGCCMRRGNDGRGSEKVGERRGEADRGGEEELGVRSGEPELEDSRDAEEEDWPLRTEAAVSAVYAFAGLTSGCSPSLCSAAHLASRLSFRPLSRALGEEDRTDENGEAGLLLRTAACASFCSLSWLIACLRYCVRSRREEDSADIMGGMGAKGGELNDCEGDSAVVCARTRDTASDVREEEADSSSFSACRESSIAAPACDARR